MKLLISVSKKEFMSIEKQLGNYAEYVSYRKNRRTVNNNLYFESWSGKNAIILTYKGKK